MRHYLPMHSLSDAALFYRSPAYGGQSVQTVCNTMVYGAKASGVCWKPLHLAEHSPLAAQNQRMFCGLRPGAATALRRVDPIGDPTSDQDLTPNLTNQPDAIGCSRTNQTIHRTEPAETGQKWILRTAVKALLIRRFWVQVPGGVPRRRPLTRVNTPAAAFAVPGGCQSGCLTGCGKVACWSLRS